MNGQIHFNAFVEEIEFDASLDETKGPNPGSTHSPKKGRNVLDLK